MSEEKVILKYPRIIFAVATQAERDLILKPALDSLGLLGRSDLWIVVTGEGKVNSTLSMFSTLTTALSLGRKSLEDVLVLNVGVCGGSKSAYSLARASQIDTVIENDFDGGRDGDSAMKLNLTKRFVDSRVCLSQDHKCSSVKDFPKRGGTYYIDSELFGIARTCATFKVRCAALKSIYYVVPESMDISFDGACKEVSKLLIEYLSTLTDVIVTQ